MGRQNNKRSRKSSKSGRGTQTSVRKVSTDDHSKGGWTGDQRGKRGKESRIQHYKKFRNPRITVRDALQKELNGVTDLSFNVLFEDTGGDFQSLPFFILETLP